MLLHPPPLFKAAPFFPPLLSWCSRLDSFQLIPRCLAREFSTWILPLARSGVLETTATCQRPTFSHFVRLTNPLYTILSLFLSRVGARVGTFNPANNINYAAPYRLFKGSFQNCKPPFRLRANEILTSRSIDRIDSFYLFARSLSYRDESLIPF